MKLIFKARRMPIGTVSHGRKKVAEGRWVPVPSRDKVPKRITLQVTVPPNWTDVEYFSGKDSKTLVRGRDAKGRMQYVYNPKFVDKSGREKFSRINVLNENFDKIRKENSANVRKRVPEAECLALIMDTGMRPGSEKDTRSDTPSYGATTLEGRHVQIQAKDVVLEYTGKKGVPQRKVIESSEVKNALRRRKQIVGDDERLFGTTGNKLLKYIKSLGGGLNLQSKDFRTHLGTETAMRAMREKSPPTTMAEYKRMVAEVGDAVAEKLGNTRSVALKSYVNPAVFDDWRRNVEKS